MTNREFSEPLSLDQAASPMNKIHHKPLENLNFAAPGNWQFTIPSFPSFEYFVKGSNVPGLNAGNATFNTPFIDVPRSGDKLQFQPLIVEFFVDERWETYIEMQRWMRAINFPETHKEHDSLINNFNFLDKHGYCDCSNILYSNDGQELFRIEYRDCFPISLEDIALEVDTIPDAITTTVTLMYSTYVIKRLPEGLI